jgi:type IV pilus assembly protein PilE
MGQKIVFNRNKGFSLIELLIVMVVVGILASVGYPSYRDHVLRTQRAEAQSALMDAASRQEQFFLDNKTYTTTIGAGGLNLAALTESGAYALSVVAPTAACPITRCYVLRATPQGGQTDDTRCASLTLSSSGTKNATGTAPTECW